MTTRTTNTTKTFPKAFTLAELDDVFPAGDYIVSTDEVLIEGLSWLAYRRVATFLNVPAVSSQQHVRRLVKVDPQEIDSILKTDRI